LRKDDPTAGLEGQQLLDENGFPVFDEDGYPVLVPFPDDVDGQPAPAEGDSPAPEEVL
jgi:hypothetical protein